MRWYLALVAALAVGALVAPAAARQAVTSADATFAVETTTVDFTLTNTGTEPIRCMRAFAPAGTTFEVVSGPAGTRSEGPGVFSNGSLTLAPGASATWKLAASPPVTSGNPPRVNVSSNCQTDVAASVRVVAKEILKPCECKNVGTRTSGWGDIQAVGAAPTRFSFRLTWTMNCGGAPGGCKGEIDIVAPGDLKLSAPKKTTIACTGKCAAGAVISTSKATIRVAGTSVNTLDSDRRAGKSFTFRFQKWCVRDGKRVAAGRGSMTVVYRANGLLDLTRSDLDGDGRPGAPKK